MDAHKIIERYKRFNLNLDVTDSSGTYLAQLLPINNSLINNMSMITQLTKWRNRSMRFFKSQFNATEESTQNWLKNIQLPSNDRILFLVSFENKFVGHYGLCNITNNSAELDNALRGERGGPSDLFKWVEHTIIRFAFDELKVNKISAMVLSLNFLALRMHKDLGFKENNRFPLSINEFNEKKEYKITSIENANTEIEYIELIFLKSQYN